MCEREPRHDSERARKLCAALHGGGSRGAIATSFWPRATSELTAWHTYKTRHFNREPGLAPMELTIGTRGKNTRPDWHGKRPKTIAIIDDDNGIRQALERMLNIGRVSRRTCSPSAEDFLAAIDTCDAGCAVVDLELGKMSGFDLACHPGHGRGKASHHLHQWHRGRNRSRQRDGPGLHRVPAQAVHARSNCSTRFSARHRTPADLPDVGPCSIYPPVEPPAQWDEGPIQNRGHPA